MESDKFKKTVCIVLEQKVNFLGKDFESICRNISLEQADKIYNWLNKVVYRKVKFITSYRNKKYKDWSTREILVFRYAFKLSGNEYRILLVKVFQNI